MSGIQKDIRFREFSQQAAGIPNITPQSWVLLRENMSEELINLIEQSLLKS
jgi:hypothetical protein